MTDKTESKAIVDKPNSKAKSMILEIMKQAREAGVELYLQDSQLKFRMKKGKLPPQIRQLLVENKPQIIEFLQAAQAAQQSSAVVIEPAPQGTNVGLSASQQGLWFIDRLEGGSAHYNIPLALRLHGQLDHQVLQQTVDAIVERHQILRTSYIEHNGDCIEQVRENVSVKLEQIDLTGLDEQQQQSQVDFLAREEAQKVFDLEVDLMLRGQLLKLADDHYVVLFTMHHIASDGWSNGILTKEFMALYNAFAQGQQNPLEPLSIQYRDFAWWQQQSLQDGGLDKQLAYWRNYLDGIPQLHSLNTDMPRRVSQSYLSASIIQKFDSNVLEGLNKLARDTGTTLFMVLQSAYALLLSRWSNETDIVIGVPIAGRNLPQVEPLIGFFINTLVLRTQVPQQGSFRDLLAQVKDNTLNAYANQDVTFDRVVEELNPKRTVAHNPLCQVKFVLQNHQDTNATFSLPKLNVSALEDEIEHIRFDLDLTISESATGLTLQWSYKKDLFYPQTIERMSQGYFNLLNQLLTDADADLTQLHLLSDSQLHKKISASHGPIDLSYRNSNVVELFEAQVQKTPDAVALKFGEQQLTYAELNSKANQLAQCLIELGAESGEYIGIYTHRCIELIVAQLAVLKSGAAYIPFEPSNTPSRLEQIINDAKIEVVLVAPQLLGNLPIKGIDVLVLENVHSSDWFDGYECDCPEQTIDGNDSAYVIYTSGSTGVPKGVEISHMALVDYLVFANQNYYQAELCGSLVVTSHGFDITLPSLYLPLLNGASVTLTDQDNTLEQLTFALAGGHGPYLLRMTPMHVQAMLQLLPQDHYPGKHVFVVGGEAFPADVAKALLSTFPQAQVYNHYGPSETVVGCAMLDVNAYAEQLDDVVPVGKGMDNTGLYVLDSNQQLVPEGVTGELYIAGPCVAKGYLNQPALSAEKFLDNPFVGLIDDEFCARMYRSGDLVKRQADGNLVFVGRVDAQVKLRGYRIELGDIQTRLKQVAGVEDAAVVIKGHGDQALLVAYVVTSNEDHQQLTVDAEHQLTQDLPQYMVPSAFVMLDALPLSANGKVDVKALPEPNARAASVYVAPSNDIESQVADLWQELLPVNEPVSVSANFFELGGHSLLATRMVSLLRQQFDINLSIKAVFDFPTIMQLAEHLSELLGLDNEQGEKVTYALTPAQQRLWFLDRLDGQSCQYHLSHMLQLDGEVTLSLLEQALANQVAVRDVFSLQYIESELGPLQREISRCSLVLEKHDLSDLLAEDKEQAKQQLIEQIHSTGFDLADDMPIRIAWIQLTPAQGILQLSCHRIALDEHSLAILVHDSLADYWRLHTGSEVDKTLLPKFSEYAIGLNERLSSTQLASSLTWWQQQLEQLPPLHSLPLDNPRAESGQGNIARLHTQFDDEQFDGIKQLATHYGTQLYTVLHTALSLVLSRHSYTNDIIIGNVYRCDSDGLNQGNLENLLVLRTNTAQANLGQMFTHVDEVVNQAHQNAGVPFEYLVEHCQVSRARQHAPLCQIVLTSGVSAKYPTVDGVSITPLCSPIVGKARMDLEIFFTEQDGRLTFDWLYDASLFNHNTITRLEQHFGHILADMVAQGIHKPELELMALKLLSDTETQQLLVECNQTQGLEVSDDLIHQRFEAACEATPDAIAVECGGQQLSYAQLNAQANRLAHYLRSNGVGNEIPVGVYCRRSNQMVVALLAILKAGGAYVPMDPDYPASRLGHIIEDSQIKLLLCIDVDADIDSLPLSDEQQALVLDSDRWQQLAAQQPDSNLTPAQGQSVNSLAYIIYTSGTTGKPKGVMLEHNSVGALIEWSLAQYTSAQLSRVLCSTSLNFDLSVFEIFVTLSSGGTVVVVDNILSLLAPENSNLNLSLINTVPSGISALLSAQMVPQGVSVLNLAGEPLKQALVADVQRHCPDMLVYNLYGPTEDTVYSLYKLFDKPITSEPTIGRVLSNTRALVLDDHKQLVPMGCVGQLYLAGAGLSRGYLNLPQLTAERFIDNPFESGQLMYQTGDLVRYLPDGDLLYVGRTDFQVKIRGFRIELSEIETHLADCEGVNSAVVMATQLSEGDTQLVGYAQISDLEFDLAADRQSAKRADISAALRTQLSTRLPEHMVPSLYVLLDKWPLTSNGKIDKKALPLPEVTDSAEQYQPPEGEIETALVEIEAKLLNIEPTKLSVNANFFELGGHSLLAVRLVSAIRSQFGRELAVQDIFDHSSIKSLAVAVAMASQKAVRGAIEVLPRSSNQLPLSYSQRRLWFVDQLEGASAQYNMASAMRLKGKVDWVALEQAFNTIIERHEVIRSTYKTVDGIGMQVVQPYQWLSLPQVDFSDLSILDRERALDKLVAAEASEVFDLSHDLMLRVKLVRMNADETVVLFTMHHIASDGWSLGVIAKEFIALYEAAKNAQPCPLAKLQLQYGDYVLWQQKNLGEGALQRQLAYWREKLDGVPSVHQLPLDRPRPARQDLSGGRINSLVSLDVLAGLNQLAVNHSASLFMVLQSAFSLLLARFSNENDIVMGASLSGRVHQDLEPLVGFFVNSVVLRSDVCFDHSFVELLEHCKGNILQAFANQDAPFDMVLDELKPERSLSHATVVQITFAIENNEKVDVDLGDVSIEAIGGKEHVAKFDLNFLANETEQGLAILWGYASAIFDRSTIQRLADSFSTLLEDIVAHPNRAIKHLSVLGEKDNAQVAMWNDTKVDYAATNCLHQLFEQQVTQNPDAIAVVHQDYSISYKALDIKANRIAQCLVQQGLKVGDIVAIMCDKSIESVAAIIGVLKAGCAYLPIDAALPQDRHKYIIEDAGVKVLLGHSDIDYSYLPSELTVLALDDERYWAAYSAQQVNLTLTAQDLAYVIFTSGTSGQPKGVMIEHQGLVNLVQHDVRCFEVDTDARILHCMALHFDAANEHLLYGLCGGGSVYLVAPDSDIFAFVNQHSITHMTLGPALLAAQQRIELPSLKVMVLGGDVVNQQLLEHWASRLKLFNQYGPTEITSTATMRRFKPGDAANNIGKPIQNKQVYVVDEHLNLCPVGVFGELLVGGIGVARGYLNLESQTHDSFIANPFVQGQRVYRTGDRVRWLPDGTLEFGSRLDSQVKLRGLRIELGEIKVQLQQQPEVEDAEVVLKEQGGNKYLVAYIVSSPQDENTLIGEVKAAIEQNLPQYMVPSAFVVIPRLPLLSGGKVDFKALPEPSLQQTKQYVAPATEIEKKLAQIWQSLLKLERIGVYDNFFAIGGDSILSIQVVSRANQAGLSLTTRQLFECQNIRQLALVVGEQRQVDCPQEPCEGDFELLPIQHHFLTNDKFASGDPHHFNQAVLLETPEDFDPEFGAKLVAALYKRHDSLRLRFVDLDADIKGYYCPLDDKMINESAICEALPADLAEDSDQLSVHITARCDHYQASLHLTDGPLLRVVYFSPAAQGQSGRLLLLVHHIVVDGVSWRILLSDMETVWRQHQSGLAIELEAKTSSFGQWTNALKEYASGDKLIAERDYWLAQYEHRSGSVLAQALEQQHPVSTSRRVGLSLDTSYTESLLKHCPDVYRTQINELLLCGVYLGMRRWSGDLALHLSLEGHGREDLFEQLDTTQTVGWFTTEFPLTLHSESLELNSIIKAVKEQCRATPNNGIGYGVLRYLAKDEQLIEKSEQASPSLVFNYLGQFDQTLNADTAFTMAEEHTGRTMGGERMRDHTFALNGSVRGGQLQFTLDYSEAQYCADEMTTLAGQIEDSLREVIDHCLSIGQGDYTPSDFPLANIDQQVLDGLAERYPSMDKIYPATAMQQGMYYHSQLDSSAYTTLVCATFDGVLELDTFRRAWQMVADRHDILRTAFVSLPAGLHQLVQQQVQLPWQVIDLSDLGEEQESRIEQLCEQCQQSGFDFAQAPLQRITVLKLAKNRHMMLWSCHHMLLDGWCKSLVYKEVTEAYQALSTNQLPNWSQAAEYQQYMRWLANTDVANSEQYWADYLADIDAPTPLVVDSLPGKRELGDQTCEISLDEDVSTKIDQFARTQKTTVNTLVQLAWGYLLHCYCGEERVLFGATIAGRPAQVPGIEQMVGLFINAIPVKLDFSQTDEVNQLIAVLQDSFQLSQEHGYLPMPQVQRQSAIASDINLFDSLIVFENYPINEAIEQSNDASQNSDALVVEDVQTQEGTVSYKLNLVASFNGQLNLSLSYLTSFFDPQTAERLLGHLAAIVSALPQITHLSEVSILSKAEQQQLDLWHYRPADYPQNVCIHQLFEQTVLAQPDAIAVSDERRQLTYQELDSLSNRLASWLREQGVGLERPVGLYCGRSVDMVIAILATLKAGGCYVPLDINMPMERISYVINEANIAHLLVDTKESIAEQIEGVNCTVLSDVNAQWLKSADTAQNIEQIGVKANHLAYIIYTSGSTGRPKGVMIEHRGLVNYIVNNIRQFNYRPEAFVLHNVSFSFDPATSDLFCGLVSGARVHIVECGGDLISKINAFKATHTIIPTAVLAAQPYDKIPSLELLITGGEACTTQMCKRWGDQTTFVNMYGPTEAVITSSFAQLTGDDRPDIGRPVANKRLYVVDKNLNKVPIGVTGELLIGGEGIARGYINQPELTAQKFIEDPFLPSKRVYRSGDMVRWLPDGSLDFVGRSDTQVKFRGFRIELGDIEAQLNSFEQVAESKVQLIDKSGDKLLAAWVVLGEKVVETDEIGNRLRERLKSVLPAYMIPTVVTITAKFVLTVNGKVDVHSLPEVVIPTLAKSSPPQTQTQKQLAQIWQELLQVEEVGIEDNFFELGGHSLLLTRLQANIEVVFSVDFPYRELFERANIAAQAELIEVFMLTGQDLSSSVDDNSEDVFIEEF